MVYLEATMTLTGGAPPTNRTAPDTVSSPRRQPPAWRSRLSVWDIKYTPYVLISPFFVLFAVFGLFPLFYNGWVSFLRWRLDEGSESQGFTGLDNYRQIIEDGDFWNALVNTFGIFVLSTVPQLLAALFLAAVLNRQIRARTAFRMGILLPYITPLAASTLVFATVFAGQGTGIMNYLLTFVGLDEPIDWRAERWSSWTAIATMVNWRWIGYNALIYLAAMQSISKDLYEAATIDGASHWKQFTNITVPLIRPAVIFTTVLATIGGMQLFSEPLLFDSNPSAATGGSDRQFQTVAVLIYEVGWKNLNLGYAAAMSWVVFLIIVVFAAINAWLTNRLGGHK